MKSYKYIPSQKLRRQYHRRWSWMRLAMTVIPAVLWSCGGCLLIMAAALALGIPM